MSISTSPSTPEMTRICLVGPVAQDAASLAAAQSLKLPIVTSDTGAEYVGDDESLSTVFVLSDFEGPVYDALLRTKQRVSCDNRANNMLNNQLLLDCRDNAVDFEGLLLYRQNKYDRFGGRMMKSIGIWQAATWLWYNVDRTAGTRDLIELSVECRAVRGRRKILGPPALQQAVRFSEGLVWNNRPIYNYCMRGVITCFTGIRKKDELTHLVHLIHSMGGSIRKEMNTKVTHLICNSSGGEKYRYAMTFRLAIIRPNWVLEAWKHRDDASFTATSEAFTALHRVKAFDGQKVCFFGFSEEDEQDMINLLKKNGGIPTDLEDPECSHVVMPNSGGHFTDRSMAVEGISPKKSAESPSSSPATNASARVENGRELLLLDQHQSQTPTERHNEHNGQGDNTGQQEVTIGLEANAGNKAMLPALPEENESTADGIPGDNVAQNGACGASDEHGNNHNRYAERRSRPMMASSSMQFIDEEPEGDAEMSTTTANKLSPRPSGAVGDVAAPTTPVVCIAPKHDGVVLTLGEANEFLNPNNISPILKSGGPEHVGDCGTIMVDESFRRIDEAKEDEDEDDDMDDYVIATREAYKRKRPEDSFDDPSLLSVDISIASNVAYGAGSAKKPKLTRTGSITRGIRRSMSFAAIKTPIKSMLRSRRNSVDPNASATSITLLESTFNESIKKPVKEKLRSIRDKITKTSKKDTPKSIKTKGLITPANLDNLKKVCNFNGAGMHTPEQSKTDRSEVDFKTPVAPGAPFGGTGGSSSKVVTRSRGKLGGFSALCKPGAVVNEHVVQSKPETKNKNTHIVKADWFWYTIQAGYANEIDYLFADTPVVDRRDSLPVSFNKRKRKRLSQRTPAEGTPLSVGKRRSSVSDAGLLSVSGSFLDCTTSPDKHESSKKNIVTEASEPCKDQPTKPQTMRQNHFMDFFHTESNYVGILDTIVTLFKEPLEEMVESENPLLNKSELKSVFGNFLPIHDVHKRMLDRLKEINGRWSEDVLIGQIVLDHRDDLLKAYPPYVNFFEQMKETLLQCDVTNPRFHAFLKINQAKPECGRQSLQDLMIRPVQRLPSISLLLNDILKHTPKTNPDSRKLDDALKAIKEVMTYINEDKRKTEGQMAMFDIFNDIDNCPPHLVSSHRSFVSRCEVTELSDSLSGRGDPLVLFLFSDTLEVCKKRSRVFNSVKSPNTNSLNLTRSSCATTKPYKHVKLMPLSTIRQVVNIIDSARAFSLFFREDRQYSFNIADEEQDKLNYLKSLSKQMAENACRTDAQHFLLNYTSDELGIDVSDINVGTLSKAFKFASKTRIREVGEEAGASGESSPSSSKALVAPMSVQPTRKNKNPPISTVGTLRHL
uniref:Protein ECT2 n=1 Tax=Anopheles atroparvus TaxID=41427 RepID=A0A182IVI0_ANOAO